jgi:hypothetical protein
LIKADMTISLGKIAQHLAGEGINLLGEQAHIIAARKQSVEQAAGFRVTTLQYAIIYKPEIAREKKSAFAWG